MLVEMRDALVAAIHGPFVSAYPDTPIVFDNQPFDWANLPDRYVTVEIMVHDTEQVTMSFATARKRVWGAVHLTVHVRAGTGSRIPLGILDWASSLLEYRRLGGIQMQVPSCSPQRDTQDWYRQSIIAPFYLDA